VTRFRAQARPVPHRREVGVESSSGCSPSHAGFRLHASPTFVSSGKQPRACSSATTTGSSNFPRGAEGADRHHRPRREERRGASLATGNIRFGAVVSTTVAPTRSTSSTETSTTFYTSFRLPACGPRISLKGQEMLALPMGNLFQPVTLMSPAWATSTLTPRTTSSTSFRYLMHWLKHYLFSKRQAWPTTGSGAKRAGDRPCCPRVQAPAAHDAAGARPATRPRGAPIQTSRPTRLRPSGGCSPGRSPSRAFRMIRELWIDSGGDGAADDRGHHPRWRSCPFPCGSKLMVPLSSFPLILLHLRAPW